MIRLRFSLAAGVAVWLSSAAALAEGTARDHGKNDPATGAPSPRGKPATAAPPDASDSVLTPEAAFARASSFYEGGQYTSCVSTFSALLDEPAESSGLSSRTREQATVYYAACLIALGRVDVADEQFRAAIRANPQMAVPSAVVFPPSVIERFVVVRSQLFEEIRRSEEERARRGREAVERSRRQAEAERARVSRLEKLASEETVVVRNRRWVASVPFGVGQFQNRDYFLGGLFLATETALLGTALTSAAIELSLYSQAGGGTNLASNPQVEQLNQNLRTANSVALYSAGALLLVMGGGILEAHLAFVPEFRDGTRKRKLPPGVRSPEPSGLSLLPMLAPERGGGTLGVVGRF
jgi:hypothetical protein